MTGIDHVHPNFDLARDYQPLPICSSGQPPDVPIFDKNLGPLVQSELGRAYLAKVPGAAQAPINDAELAAVINWMLSEYSAEAIPDDFILYDAAEVARYQSTILTSPVELKASLTAASNGTL